MFDYIQKFKNLPKEIYAELSSARAVSVIDGLEKEYGLNLARSVMLIAIREVPFDKLETHLAGEFGLDGEKAKKLGNDLRTKLFNAVSAYLAKNTTDENKALPEKPGVSGRPAMNSSKVPGPSMPVAAPKILPPALNSTQEIKSFSSTPAPLTPQTKKIAVATAQKPQIANIRFQPPVKPTKEPVKLKTTPFFFSPEDEEEISNLSSKAITLGNAAGQQETEKFLEDIINEFSNNFTSADAINRLRMILRTYLQGIRDRLETKLTLVKDYRSGGAGIDEKLAISIINSIEKGAGKKPAGNVPDNSSTAKPKSDQVYYKAARDLDYDLGKELEKRKKEATQKDIPAARPMPTAPVPPEKTIVKSEPSIPAKFQPEKILPKEEVEKPKPAKPEPAPKPKIDALVNPGFPRKNPVFGESGRKKIEDVKYTPKILTPIEELKFLDLNAFRRLFKNEPEEAAKKIMEKILLLEDEEYAKKLAGIKAWRQSPIFGIYLEMAGEAMAEKIPMASVINKRKTEGKPFLTEPEIHAIMDLNRGLRF